MTIHWTRSARRQLVAAHNYVASDNPAAADQLLRKMVNAVSQLASYPLAGREGRVKGARELVIADTPYVVAYRIKGKPAVQILAVLHGKRRWPDNF